MSVIFTKKISKTIFIKQQNNGLNYIENTELLDKSYFSLIDNLNKR